MWIGIELAALVAAFAAIVWGVLRFFVPPRQQRWKGGAVAALAVTGFANQFLDTRLAASGAFPALTATSLYVGSMVIFWRAVRASAREPLTAIFAPDIPTRIIVAGPYRFVRHPFYVAYSLFWTGGWVGAGTWSTAAVAAVMITLYAIAARREEAKFAASPIAAAYRRYQQETGFFLPKLALGRPAAPALREGFVRVPQSPTT